MYVDVHSHTHIITASVVIACNLLVYMHAHTRQVANELMQMRTIAHIHNMMKLYKYVSQSYSYYTVVIELIQNLEVAIAIGQYC